MIFSAIVAVQVPGQIANIVDEPPGIVIYRQVLVQQSFSIQPHPFRDRAKHLMRDKPMTDLLFEARMGVPHIARLPVQEKPHLLGHVVFGGCYMYQEFDFSFPTPSGGAVRQAPEETWVGRVCA